MPGRSISAFILAETSFLVGIQFNRLQFTIRHGWVKARQQEQPRGRWIIWADEAELERLRQLHRRPSSYHVRRLWVEERPGSDSPESAAIG